MTKEHQAVVNNDPIRDVSRDLFSASIGSVFCCYVGQPLDTVKVRMQTSPQQFPNIFTTVLKVYGEGIVAFWKGSVPTAAGMILENGMAFGVNEGLKRAFPDVDRGTTNEAATITERPSLFKPFLIGGFTGCCSALVLLPSEVVKAKTQVVVGQNISSKEIIQQMISKQGYKSMFVGLDAQLARDSSFYAIFFGGYELNKYILQTLFPSIPEELKYFLAGGFAGMMGWTAAMPFDVPKTNVQSRWGSDAKVIGNYWPEMKVIARERGLLGFYNGLAPTLVRAFPANAALFLGVELGKKFFDTAVWKKS